VLSHDAAVELVNRITGAANLKRRARRELVDSVINIVAGEGAECVDFEELIVRGSG